MKHTKNPITHHEGGHVSWHHQPLDSYLATGVDRNGKRFRIINSNWDYINGLNLWQGNKWLLRNGKKYLIKRVIN